MICSSKDKEGITHGKPGLTLVENHARTEGGTRDQLAGQLTDD